MARSRLEKIGTIFSRTNALINTGAVAWEERPVWYDIYEAFPPKEEPRFDRPRPNMKLKEIFYEEDKLRGMFHKNNKQIGATNMFNNKKSVTQRFIENYKKLESQYEEVDSKQLYQEAVQLLRLNEHKNEEELMEQSSLSSTFKEAQSNRYTKQYPEKLNVSNIFKE